MRSFSFALCGTMFTFAMTALGAAVVFIFGRPISDRANRLCMGFAGGMMSAAAVFSLLLPAIDGTAAAGGAPWLTAAGGFALGAGVMGTLDALAERFCSHADGAAHRRAMLVTAVTLHNIPEGIAVGLACAAAAQAGGAAMTAALGAALGIGIQNLPEGAAIALPLHQGGMSHRRSFALGALSGAAEPLGGMAAVMAAAMAGALLPGLMAFAAGAMMWVVFYDMLPGACARRDGAAAAAVGYVLMMALDVALG